MQTIEYNVTLTREDNGNWNADCQEPMLPGIGGADRRGVLWNLYKVIFEDLHEMNDTNPFMESLELRVNLIEPE